MLDDLAGHHLAFALNLRQFLQHDVSNNVQQIDGRFDIVEIQRDLALLTRKLSMSLDRRLLLLGCFLIQACGVVSTLLMPNVVGFMLGSALVGLPFTAIALFGMQEARRLAGLNATGFMAVLTAVYGVGQIVAPLLVGVQNRCDRRGRRPV